MHFFFLIISPVAQTFKIVEGHIYFWNFYPRKFRQISEDSEKEKKKKWRHSNMKRANKKKEFHKNKEQAT